MIVAVAGGAGGVGKTILEKLLQKSRFKVIVLSRSEPREDIVLQKAQHVQLDYDDIASMTTELERHNIHTIISAIGIVSDESSQSQLNLIEAAEKAKCTERFIPSEYSFIQTADLLPLDPSIQYWLDAANRLKSSSLKYTRVIPGFFMDYWGMPHVKTYLQPYTFGINIAEGKASIPGDGNDVICMTYTADMATYMTKLLDLDEWSEFTVIVGDEVTYNQLISMSEEICGKRFEVHYDSFDRIYSGDVTVPPMPDGTEYAETETKEITKLVSLLTVHGVFDLPKEGRLNARFPDVQPITMKQFLIDAWRKN